MQKLLKHCSVTFCLKLIKIMLDFWFSSPLNIELDKRGSRVAKQSTFSENINDICSEFFLIDIWRIRNPTTSTFTRIVRIERSRNGIVQS